MNTVRRGVLIGDPYEIPTRVGGLRGLAFDPGTNSIYLSVNGLAGEFSRIIQMDRTTGDLLNSTDINYPSDLWLTTDGNLLAGTAAYAPILLSKSLEVLGQFEDDEREFPAEFVPEPSALLLVLIGATSACVARYKVSRINRLFVRRKKSGP